MDNYFSKGANGGQFSQRENNGGGIKLSSANAYNFSRSNKADTNRAYRTGPRIEPCTVPNSKSNITEFEPSTET